MRRWFKYTLNYIDDSKWLPKDTTYLMHKESMRYDINDGYDTKEEFFKIYFYNGHPRLKLYNDYLRQILIKEDVVLSLGSGRCINELLLIEDGFNIICSDLDQPCKDETSRLFPSLKFFKYDIASGPFESKFNTIISLSMFYLFDDRGLLKIFKNIAESLKSGGKLIFDAGGAEDNIFSYFLDNIICRNEIYVSYLMQRLRRRSCVVTRKQQGYRSKNKEVISIARQAGFKLYDFESSEYSTETRRSTLLAGLPGPIINRLGALVPYVRMFTFVKNY